MLKVIGLSGALAILLALQLAYDLGRGKRERADMDATVLGLGGCLGTMLVAFVARAARVTGEFTSIAMIFVGFFGGAFAGAILYDRLFLPRSTSDHRIP